MLNLEEHHQDGDEPTEHTVSSRWQVRLIVFLFCFSFLMLGLAEFARITGYAGMENTITVASEVTRGFSYAIVGAMNLDKFFKKG